MTCGNCGTTWTHTDRVGCCTTCHRAFRGMEAFERHQVGPRDTNGRLRCVDPESAAYPPESSRYPDKVFRDSGAGRGSGKGSLWALTPSAEQSEQLAARVERLKQAKTEGPIT